jgi:hypothetical protein
MTEINDWEKWLREMIEKNDWLSRCSEMIKRNYKEKYLKKWAWEIIERNERDNWLIEKISCTK